MDAARPEVPPDFIFPPGEETSFRLSTLKSLANWRSAHHHLPSTSHLFMSGLTIMASRVVCRPTESRTCLLDCVVELFTLYKVHPSDHLHNTRLRLVVVVAVC